MIGRCSLDSQHVGHSGILQMLVVLISGHQMKTKATMHLRDTKGRNGEDKKKCNSLLFSKQPNTKVNDGRNLDRTRKI